MLKEQDEGSKSKMTCGSCDEDERWHVRWLIMDVGKVEVLATSIKIVDNSFLVCCVSCLCPHIRSALSS